MCPLDEQEETQRSPFQKDEIEIILKVIRLKTKRK